MGLKQVNLFFFGCFLSSRTYCQFTLLNASATLRVWKSQKHRAVQSPSKCKCSGNQGVKTICYKQDQTVINRLVREAREGRTEAVERFKWVLIVLEQRKNALEKETVMSEITRFTVLRITVQMVRNFPRACVLRNR